MTLVNQETIALQARQVFGDSWPGSTHQIGEVSLADRDSKERAAGIRDSEIRA